MKILDFSLFLFLLSTCLGLDDVMIEFSVKYFSQRDVKFVCLLTCENSFALRKFTKIANNRPIAVETACIDMREFDYGAIKRCARQRYANVGVLLDAKCNNSRNILNYASQEMLFNSPRKWLVTGSNTIVWNKTIKNISTNIKRNIDVDITDKSMYDIFIKLNISVDADIIVATQDIQTINLYEVFNYGKIQGGKLKFNSIGTWNPGNELHLNFVMKYKYYRRWNFEKLNLRMVLVTAPRVKNITPDLATSRQPVPGVSTITRTSSMILQVVSEIHNIKFKYFVVDRWIGNYDRNTSAAVTNSLYFREQDISPLIRMLNLTFGYLDILYPPLTSIETRYYYRIPTSGPGKFENQFLRPLSSGAWLGAFAVGVLSVLLLILSSKIERRPSATEFAIFSVVASFCQQFFEDDGEKETRRTTTGKMTILVTGLSCVLIYNYYTSSVVSWLLSGPPPSINSLRELLESPLELIFEDIGYTRSWLQMPDYYYNKRNAKVEDELRQRKVLNKKEGEPLLVAVGKGIEMVKAGGYAYHTEVFTANTLISRTFTQNELCELGSLQSMEKTLLYACLQKDSPYKEFFVWSLLRLLERGIVSCMQERTKAPDVSCEGSSPRALALGGAAPAFILLAAGYVLASSIMIIERIHYNTKNVATDVRGYTN